MNFSIRCLVPLITIFATIASQPVQTTADIVAVQFDAGGDNEFTLADASLTTIVIDPASFGSLGWLNTGNLLSFGNASGNTSGGPTPHGLFNSDAAGNISPAMSLSAGTMVSASTGTTGWGVITSDFGTGLSAGNHNLGFLTSHGNYGWMNITLSDGGTINDVSDDTITINQTYIQSNTGFGIVVGAVPEPVTFPILGLFLGGYFIRRKR